MLVVDDHDLVRLGLRTLVQSQATCRGLDVKVFEARTLQQAMARYREHEPDIDLVLLDLHLPDAHGLSGLIGFMAQFPRAHVVVLSGVSDPVLMREAVAHGASAYLPKSGDLQEVVHYIQTQGLLATQGTSGEPLPAAPPDTLETRGGGMRIVRSNSGEAFQLTARQATILDSILSGHSNRQIADIAHLSEGTVKNHVSTLLVLFGVRSRAQLISQLR